MTHNRNKATTLWTFAITSIALFMVSLDNLVVTTALPVIRTDLGASLEQLEWTVTVYTLGSAAAALAPSVEALILARAVQGLGGAIVMPLTLTLLSAAVAPER